MEALPSGSLQGRLRMTEQGETIGQKYAHFASAVYNIELLMASAAAATAAHRNATQQADPLAPIPGSVGTLEQSDLSRLAARTGFHEILPQRHAD